MDTKTCTKCKRPLPLTAFRLRNGKPFPSGSCLAAHWCMECISRKRKTYYDTREDVTKLKFGSLRTRARKLKLEFNVTLKEFSELIHQPCAYGQGQRPEVRIGVDRKDSSTGYTPLNLVPCCSRHNEMKGCTFSYADMLRIVELFPAAKVCGNNGGGRKKSPRT